MIKLLKNLLKIIFLWQWITTDKLWCRIIVDLFCPVHSALDTPVACEQTEPSLRLVGIQKMLWVYIFPAFRKLKLILKKNTNEWMNEESWMRRQQTCPLRIHFNMRTLSSDISIQRRHWEPLSVHLWGYCTHPTHDVADVMSEGWPQHRGLRPLLFSNSGVGSFTSH